MIYFIKKILIFIVSFLVVLFILDNTFTQVYTKSKVIRNKIQFVFKEKEKNYDYSFLGSSRVAWNINTKLIDSICKTKSINLGIEAQPLSETFLTLQLLIDNDFKVKKYFIQIDQSGITKEVKKSFIGASYLMPYIGNVKVKNYFKKYDNQFYLNYYFPFYRYINYSPKIGFEEFMKTLKGKKTKESGFLQFSIKDTIAETFSFSKEYKVNNELLNEMNKYIEDNDLNVVFFTAPYYNPQNKLSFQKKLENYYVKYYIDSISKKEFFKDAVHLNYLGVKKFSKMLIRDFQLDEK